MTKYEPYYCTPKTYNTIQPTYSSIKDYDTLSKATAESGDSDSFEFDVRPKRRYFENPQEKRRYVEEYTRKKKTELCKNYQLSGQCKFGDTCSFAHGCTQLQPKQHLHEKYKTKPCKRFHKQGFCCYGNRCQYTHDELRDSRRQDDIKYIREVYQRVGLPTLKNPLQLSRSMRYDIQRFWSLSQLAEVSKPQLVLVNERRLESFKLITDDINFLSVETSRKGSQTSQQ